MGHFLQARLDTVLVSWQESINWAVLLERQSNATFVRGFCLLCFAVCLRRAIYRYGRNVSVAPIDPSEPLSHSGVALFSVKQAGKSPGSQSAARMFIAAIAVSKCLPSTFWAPPGFPLPISSESLAD